MDNSESPEQLCRDMKIRRWSIRRLDGTCGISITWTYVNGMKYEYRVSVLVH